MPRIITYSLKPDAVNSDEYFQTISAFADSWLAVSRPEVRDLVTGFRAHQLDRGEPVRSEAEYIFELLVLGVILREHGEEINHTTKWAERWLHGLVILQDRHPRAEKAIKTLRGWLGWFASQARGKARREDDIALLIAWLEANGEALKGKRIGQWNEFFNAAGTAFKKSAVSQCLELAGEFAKTSQEVLGSYTENVARFLAEEAPQYRHRYDTHLLTHTRLEYHLGLLGTEILNRAYRQSFLAAQRKIVILPPCMCAPAEKCKAVETLFGAKCLACTPGCRVNQITKLGEKHGFGVTMIPDDVKVFGSGKGMESVGLVGVSCALTNWNGGWETGTLGIPAQGMVLDYVGCKFHWDKAGIPTDVNLKKLEEILGI